MSGKTGSVYAGYDERTVEWGGCIWKVFSFPYATRMLVEYYKRLFENRPVMYGLGDKKSKVHRRGKTIAFRIDAPEEGATVFPCDTFIPEAIGEDPGYLEVLKERRMDAAQKVKMGLSKNMEDVGYEETEELLGSIASHASLALNNLVPMKLLVHYAQGSCQDGNASRLVSDVMATMSGRTVHEEVYLGLLGLASARHRKGKDYETFSDRYGYLAAEDLLPRLETRGQIDGALRVVSNGKTAGDLGIRKYRMQRGFMERRMRANYASERIIEGLKESERETAEKIIGFAREALQYNEDHRDLRCRTFRHLRKVMGMHGLPLHDTGMRGLEKALRH